MLNVKNLHSGGEIGQGKIRTKMIRGAGMNFQRGMWAEAWAQSINARKFVALAVLGELAIKFSMEWFEVSSSLVSESAVTFASTILWAFLAYAVHAQILLPHYGRSAMTGAKVFGFALRSFGIGIAMATAVLGLAIVVFVVTFIWGTVFRAQLPRVVELIALLAGVALVFTVFVRLATLLPAYVADRVGGVDAAIKRGKAQFSWIAGRLLIGPCLLAALTVALYWLLPIPFDDELPFWNEKQVFLPVNVHVYLLFNIVQAFVTSLAAVILSRAFLRAEGMPDTTTA